MAFSQSSSSLAAAPNVTPLIDVLLVLLIIFMVIVPVSPRGLDALVPQPPAANSDADSTPLVVAVLPGAGGAVTYCIGGQRFSHAGLVRVLKQASALRARPQLFVAGDPRLEYRAVAETVSVAHLAGFSDVGLMHTGAADGCR